MHESVHVELFGINAVDAFASRWRTPPPEHKVRFTFHVKLPDGTTFTCQELSMLSLTVLKLATVLMGTPKDAGGNDTKVDGAYTFNNLTPSVATITPNADGTGFDIVGGPVANLVAQIEVSADVDLGTGVKTHTETLPIALQAGEAVTFAATIGPESDPT